MSNEDMVLFDGHCPMCNGLTKSLQKKLYPDSKLRFIGLESKEGVEIYSNLSDKIKSIDSMILIRNNKAYVRSAAGIRTLLYMRKRWMWLYPFLWLIPLPIRDLAYILIAKIRYKIISKPKYTDESN